MKKPVAPSLVLTGLVAALALAGCEEPKGEVLSCALAWSCDGTEVSSDERSTCTDPADPERAAQIGAYEAEFADTCAGVNVQCVGGAIATCAATCAPAGECAIADAKNLIL